MTRRRFTALLAAGCVATTLTTAALAATATEAWGWVPPAGGMSADCSTATVTVTNDEPSTVPAEVTGYVRRGLTTSPLTFTPATLSHRQSATATWTAPHGWTGDVTARVTLTWPGHDTRSSTFGPVTIEDCTPPTTTTTTTTTVPPSTTTSTTTTAPPPTTSTTTSTPPTSTPSTTTTEPGTTTTASTVPPSVPTSSVVVPPSDGTPPSTPDAPPSSGDPTPTTRVLQPVVSEPEGRYEPRPQTRAASPSGDLAHTGTVTDVLLPIGAGLIVLGLIVLASRHRYQKGRP